MTRVLGRLAALLAGILMAGLLTPTAPTLAAPPEEPEVSTGRLLSDVDCVAKKVCFAVGTNFYSEPAPPGPFGEPRTLRADRPLVAVWNGRRWRETDFPTIARFSEDSHVAQLTEISCTATTRLPRRATTYCVAIGSYLSFDPDFPDTYDYGPLTAVWNGERWRVVEKPRPPMGIASLYPRREAIECTAQKSCHALVATGDDRQQTFGTWDGRAWRTSSLPKPDNSQALDLTCWATRRCVAVGAHYAGQVIRPIHLRLQDRSWTRLRRPPARGGLSSSECTGPRFCVVADERRLLVDRATGRWSSVRPLRGRGESAIAISCASRQACLAVGRRVPASTEGTLPSALSYDGRRWRRTAPPPSPGPDTDLSDADCPVARWCTALSAYFTPEGRLQRALLRWNGRTWRTLTVAYQAIERPPG